MICPYAVNRTVVVQTKYGYNDENIQTSAVTIENSIANFLECQKENCGAYKDGRCCYNQVP